TFAYPMPFRNALPDRASEPKNTDPESIYEQDERNRARRAGFGEVFKAIDRRNQGDCRHQDYRSGKSEEERSRIFSRRLTYFGSYLRRPPSCWIIMWSTWAVVPHWTSVKAGLPDEQYIAHHNSARAAELRSSCILCECCFPHIEESVASNSLANYSKVFQDFLSTPVCDKNPENSSTAVGASAANSGANVDNNRRPAPAPPKVAPKPNASLLASRNSGIAASFVVVGTGLPGWPDNCWRQAPQRYRLNVDGRLLKRSEPAS
uniref:PWWP domain-containing protein n=1 Tax=Macrostomum lignano TaxID=282301 RepID=A0A1I8F5Q2_9PLAT